MDRPRRSKRRKSASEATDEPEPSGSFFMLPFPMPIQRQPDAASGGFSSEEQEYFDSLDDEGKDGILGAMAELAELEPPKPLRFHILGSTLSPSCKRAALQKLELLQDTSSGSQEYSNLKQWVDGMLGLPLGQYMPMPVNFTGNNAADCEAFLLAAQQRMDASIYGMRAAKQQTLQILAQSMTNPVSGGHSIALQGPAGIGKTSFAQEAIAKVLGRPFFFVSLGGMADATTLVGHSYTYSASRWGRIADILMHARCMNPVIFFDELDKVSATAGGQEIINTLIHLTDKSQNHRFVDKYFPDVELDLSNALFIFSMNNEANVSRILLDRMTTLRLSGYSFADKLEITRKHLLPKAMKQYGFLPGEVSLTPEVLEQILKDNCISGAEPGVRSILRLLDKLFGRLNMLRLGVKGMPWAVSLGAAPPYEITASMALRLLREDKKPERDISLQMMYL